VEVLFVTYKYPPSIGGMQKQSFELINRFERVAKAHRLVYDQNGSLLFFFMSLLVRMPYILLRNPSIGVVHFNDGVCAMMCSWLRLFTKRKLSVTYHGLDLVFPNKLYQFIITKWIINFDIIITVSDYTKEVCIEKGFDTSKVFVIYNGVSKNEIVQLNQVPEYYKQLIDQIQLSGRKIITSIGRPVKRKGFVWFVRHILPRLNNHVFLLIGPQPEYGICLRMLIKLLPKKISNQLVIGWGLSTEHTQLLELERENSIQDKFRWLSHVDHNTKNYLLSNSDLFVMPNVKVDGDMEGFGLVALEANMQGAPVVASRLEGITSAIVHRSNGVLIPASNFDEWIDVLNHVGAKVPGGLLSGEKLSQYVIQKYSWSKMVKGYKEVFQLSLNAPIVNTHLANH